MGATFAVIAAAAAVGAVLAWFLTCWARRHHVSYGAQVRSVQVVFAGTGIVIAVLAFHPSPGRGLVFAFGAAVVGAMAGAAVALLGGDR